MNKPVETQPGSPHFDGAEAYEQALKEGNRLLWEALAREQQRQKLLLWRENIQQWYETADRSAHSWAELDKIMENQDD